MATINGHITFFDSRSNLQVGSIEGKNDLHIGRSDTDLITAKKSKVGFHCLRKSSLSLLRPMLHRCTFLEGPDLGHSAVDR